jgi:tetratricopeptide (TPR) repeat protein
MQEHAAGKGNLASRAEPSAESHVDASHLVEAADEARDDVDILLDATDVGWPIDEAAVTLREAAAAARLVAGAKSDSADVHESGPRPSLPAPSRRVSKGPPPLPRKGVPPLPPPTPPPPKAATGGAPSAARGAEATARKGQLRAETAASPEALVEHLRARAAALEAKNDPVGAARALVELAVATDAILGDEPGAAAHARAALRFAPGSTAAHGILRRASYSRTAQGALLEHLEHELASATGEQRRIELLCEKARVLEAIGGRSDEVRAAWQQALEHAPEHPAALKGLEVELVARTLASGTPSDWDALAAHLGRMAETYVNDARLSAWLEVERARILERRLDRIDAARAALERARTLDPAVGPVRDALVRHVAAQGDWTALVALLDDEAQIEADGARAARLELDAGLVAALRLGDAGRARDLLERAAARAPTAPSVDRRVLDELVRLHEADARWTHAARARRARLRFVSDPTALAYELGILAMIAEREGDNEAAIADVHRALSLDGGDPGLVEWLDRLLAVTGKPEARIATWLQEAARADDPTRRAQALVAAARVCEDVGRRADAVRHLRSAWVACPGEPEALDGLARLLAPAAPEATDVGARALVELYGQAVEAEGDVGRKIAYLERVAVLWEEILGDPSRAARAYEAILALDPERRAALLGLQRSAARSGDERTAVKALLDEARITADPRAELALRVRAARGLARLDASRAMQLVREVLDRDPTHRGARELEGRLAVDAGRWEVAAKSLRARIDAETAARRADGVLGEPDAIRRQQVSMWLALAQLQHVRLRAASDALASLERARALDPLHPVPVEEVLRVLEAKGDARALRDALDRLAASAQTLEARTRYLVRAAEIDELRLGDDASAARTYQRALAGAPDDELVADRLARLVSRRARKRTPTELAEISTLLGKRIERAPTPEATRALTFELVSALVDGSQEPMRATSLLEGLLSDNEGHVPALRTLEWLRRRASVDVAALARVLARQAAAFEDVSARLGALWNLAGLEEWVLPNGDPGATYRAILALDPADASALEATLRRELVGARRGDARSRASAIQVLRALAPFAPDEDARLATELRLGLMLEASASEASDGAARREARREALEWYRDALRIDRGSWAAATGVARLASELGDAEGSLAAAEALADLSDAAPSRARHWLDAADLLLGPEEHPRLGPRNARRDRAVALLERALDADPDAMAVATRLAAELSDLRRGERLVSVLRAALTRARNTEAIVFYGSEIARVARGVLNDLPLAIDALRRVRSAAPQDIPSLLTLAELCVAQRVWPDAVEVLEAVVATSQETPPKLTALFALASIYEKVLARPAEVDRVLRAALSIAPSNTRALRALLRRLTGAAQPPDEASVRTRRREIASLLERLAEAEPDLEARTGVLLELSEVHTRLGDARAGERALVMAVATSPTHARAFARLTSHFRSSAGAGGTFDSVGYARALAAVVSLGDQFGRLDARWLAALGHVEVDALERPAEGIVHLQRAIEVDPTLYETRRELAAALAKQNRPAEAARLILSMIDPRPHPLLSTLEPTAGLELLERCLTADRRAEEALVATELRAIAGDVDDETLGWIRARKLPALEASPGTLDRAALVTHVLPAEGRHVLLEVAAAIAGAEAKVLRSDLSDLAIGPRDRIASRSGHPTRLLLDRLARQLGVGEVELVVAPRATRVRVLTQDTPWIVLPPSVAELPETAQLVALGRAVARVAFGVPWLDEIELPGVEAYLVGAARQVAPAYGPDSPSASAYASALGRALTRRQRKLLDELAPHLASGAAGAVDWSPADFASSIHRAELRLAYVLGGDLLAVADELRTRDAAFAEATTTNALAAALEHAELGDVIRFAFTPDAISLRRRIGSVWMR